MKQRAPALTALILLLASAAHAEGSFPLMPREPARFRLPAPVPAPAGGLDLRAPEGLVSMPVTEEGFSAPRELEYAALRVLPHLTVKGGSKAYYRAPRARR